MTTAIEVAHLIKRYKKSARHVIKGVSFMVESKQAPTTEGYTNSNAREEKSSSQQAASGPCARMCRKGRRQGCDGYRPCARR